MPASNMSTLNPSMTPSMGPEMNTGGQVKVETATEEPAVEPAPKKSRTNTPWTAAEENMLRTLKTQNKSWGEIAKARDVLVSGIP